MAAAGPAAQDPEERQPAARPEAVPGDRLVAVFGTGRQVPAMVADEAPRASAGRPGSIPCRQAGPALPARRRRNCGGGCELGCSPARAGHHPASALDAPRHSRRQAPRRRRSAAAGAGAIGRAEADGRLRARPAFNCLPSVRAEGDDAQHVLKVSKWPNTVRLLASTRRLERGWPTASNEHIFDLR